MCILRIIGAYCFLVASPQEILAQKSVCANVKLEIVQEVTFERQGFEATMTLSNPTVANLSNLAIEVTFQNAQGNGVVATSDPENLEALFFIRLTSHTQLPTGVVAGSSETLRWLIVPSFEAGGTTVLGEEYRVGANLSYALGGEPTEIKVSPDTIQVKPMPLLTLDYFLPRDVYGDDPFTLEKEEPVPFPLGVRVRNTGYGVAKDLQIESGQPEIIENELGLLVDFLITGSEVNGAPATNSLNARFGDVLPQSASTAQWTMISSLDGEFRDFSASFVHDDELGGELTSLIEEVNTHELLGDVLVNLSGRDSIRDFLVRGDEGALRVYETDNVDSDVFDLSSITSATSNGLQIQVKIGEAGITAPEGGAIFAYGMAADPTNGRAVITSLVRGDGKIMPLVNAWKSKRFNEDTAEWEHFVHVFDADYLDNGSSYYLGLDEAAMTNEPPVLSQPFSQIILSERTFRQRLTAFDPDQDSLTFSSDNLPTGATLSELSSNSAELSWSPLASQTGFYSIRFTVSDGDTSDTKELRLVVVEDSNLLLAWQMKYWNDSTDPALIGLDADPDNDASSNLMEFVGGTDPTDPASLILLRIEVEGENKLLGFTRRKGLDDDYNYLIYANPGDLDPSEWNWLEFGENDVEISENIEKGTLEDVLLTHTSSLGSEFYFLEINEASAFSQLSRAASLRSSPLLGISSGVSNLEGDRLLNADEAQELNFLVWDHQDSRLIQGNEEGQWEFSFLRPKDMGDVEVRAFKSVTLRNGSWQQIDLGAAEVTTSDLFGNHFVERVHVPIDTEIEPSAFFMIEGVAIPKS